MSYTIIGAPHCAYCESAKMLLRNNEYEFEYLDMQKMTPADLDVYMSVADKPFRTVPQVFVKAESSLQYIGGFEDLREHVQEQK